MNMEHDVCCPALPAENCECYKDGSGIHSCGWQPCQCIRLAVARKHEREAYARHLDLLAIEYDYMNPTENSEIVWTLNEVVRILKADEGSCCREDEG